MSAAYDQYDYTSYWPGRDYEHKSEVVAIKAFLTKIKKVKTILEVGAGFGRLAASYAFRAKKVILSDPSAKTLKVARETYKNKANIKFVHSSLENLPAKIRSGSVDLILMIRVLHHIENIDKAFGVISKLVKDRGYFIIEFANKRHFKSVFSHLTKGDFKYWNDKTPIDIRSSKSKKMGTLPFINYHPDTVIESLQKSGFEIIERRSVSNIRSVFLKRILPVEVLVAVEKLLQKPLSLFYFGPSIFLLVRKRG